MLKTVLIDDEPSARAVTRSLLAEHFSDKIELVGEADGMACGHDLLLVTKPDLLFLDIDMPDGTGFDLLEKWSPDPPFGVIFVTGFDHYAIDAFRFAAFDFMVKPLDPGLFQSAVARFLESRRRVQEVQMEIVRKCLAQKTPDRLLVPNQNGFQVVQLNDLIYIESEGSYSTLFSKNQPPLVSSRNLGNFENMLPSPPFMRVHQSFLINLMEVVAFESGDTYEAALSNAKRVPVSRRRKQEFVEAMHRGSLPDL